MTPRATAKNAARISRVVGCAAGASPSAMMPGIKRGGLPHVVLNLHRSHNASLLSPSRTRLVSFAFGERSGEGPSKPFKCSWFLTPQASGTFPAPRNTPAPTGQHYTARISQRPLKNPDHRTGASKVVRTVPCAGLGLRKHSAHRDKTPPHFLRQPSAHDFRQPFAKHKSSPPLAIPLPSIPLPKNSALFRPTISS
jgi:hypothetical protein